MPKSLPLCLAGDNNNLSTFSSNTNGGCLTASISSIAHHKTPFFPSIPLLFDNVCATE